MNVLFCQYCEGSSFEFVDCKAGTTCWQCRDCAQYAYDFHDSCSGG